MSADQQTSTTQQAKEAAGRITDDVRSQSASKMRQAQETAAKTANEQKNRAAQSVSSLADALRETGQHMQDNNQGAFGDMADRAADRLEQFSHDLQNKSVGDMVDDIEDFARRDPGLFLGGAFLAGLLGARFFRSSTPTQPRHDRYSSQDYRRSGRTGYGRQGSFGAETAEEDYTGSYAPNYYGTGTAAESTYSAPQAPTGQPTDYPPVTDAGDQSFKDASERTNE